MGLWGVWISMYFVNLDIVFVLDIGIVGDILGMILKEVDLVLGKGL